MSRRNRIALYSLSHEVLFWREIEKVIKIWMRDGRPCEAMTLIFSSQFVTMNFYWQPLFFLFFACLLACLIADGIKERQHPYWIGNLIFETSDFLFSLFPSVFLFLHLEHHLLILSSCLRKSSFWGRNNFKRKDYSICLGSILWKLIHMLYRKKFT